jgi:hypothetical protein
MISSFEYAGETNTQVNSDIDLDARFMKVMHFCTFRRRASNYFNENLFSHLFFQSMSYQILNYSIRRENKFILLCSTKLLLSIDCCFSRDMIVAFCNVWIVNCGRNDSPDRGFGYVLIRHGKSPRGSDTRGDRSQYELGSVLRYTNTNKQTNRNRKYKL